VEVISRLSETKRFVCLLNHSAKEQKLRKIDLGRDLLSNDPGALESVPPFGIRVIEIPRSVNPSTPN
jgi:hypothetical protein